MKESQSISSCITSNASKQDLSEFYYQLPKDYLTLSYLLHRAERFRTRANRAFN